MTYPISFRSPPILPFPASFFLRPSVREVTEVTATKVRNRRLKGGLHTSTSPRRCYSTDNERELKCLSVFVCSIAGAVNNVIEMWRELVVQNGEEIYRCDFSFITVYFLPIQTYFRPSRIEDITVCDSCGELI